MLLEFNNISKSYGHTRALVDFSARLGPGIHALLGPNGSGKSTLMGILTDNIKADSGSIVFNGEDTLKMGARFREKLGFMPQYPGLYASFTARSFLWYIAALKGMKKEDAEAGIPEVLEAVDLTDVADRRIGSFSGGMKQRLALAQAVLGSPSVLVLDEPTAGLDPKQRISVRNYIAGIALNRIVLIATHVVSDVEYIADSVIMLKKGVIADDAPPDRLIRKIDGLVWSVCVDGSESVKFAERFRVVSMRHDEHGVSLRILSDSAPSADAVSVSPSLEDYYLYTFGERPAAGSAG